MLAKYVQDMNNPTQYMKNATTNAKDFLLGPLTANGRATALENKINTIEKKFNALLTYNQTRQGDYVEFMTDEVGNLDTGATRTHYTQHLSSTIAKEIASAPKNMRAGLSDYFGQSLGYESLSDLVDDRTGVFKRVADATFANSYVRRFMPYATMTGLAMASGLASGDADKAVMAGLTSLISTTVFMKAMDHYGAKADANQDASTKAVSVLGMPTIMSLLMLGQKNILGAISTAISGLAAYKEMKVAQKGDSEKAYWFGAVSGAAGMIASGSILNQGLSNASLSSLEWNIEGKVSTAVLGSAVENLVGITPYLAIPGLMHLTRKNSQTQRVTSNILAGLIVAYVANKGYSALAGHGVLAAPNGKRLGPTAPFVEPLDKGANDGVALWQTFGYQAVLGNARNPRTFKTWLQNMTLNAEALKATRFNDVNRYSDCIWVEGVTSGVANGNRISNISCITDNKVPVYDVFINVGGANSCIDGIVVAGNKTGERSTTITLQAANPLLSKKLGITTTSVPATAGAGTKNISSQIMTFCETPGNRNTTSHYTSTALLRLPSQTWAGIPILNTLLEKVSGYNLNQPTMMAITKMADDLGFSIQSGRTLRVQQEKPGIFSRDFSQPYEGDIGAVWQFPGSDRGLDLLKQADAFYDCPTHESASIHLFAKTWHGVDRTIPNILNEPDFVSVVGLECAPGAKNPTGSTGSWNSSGGPVIPTDPLTGPTTTTTTLKD